MYIHFCFSNERIPRYMCFEIAKYLKCVITHCTVQTVPNIILSTDEPILGFSSLAYAEVILQFLPKIICSLLVSTLHTNLHSLTSNKDDCSYVQIPYSCLLDTYFTSIAANGANLEKYSSTKRYIIYLIYLYLISSISMKRMYCALTFMCVLR